MLTGIVLFIFYLFREKILVNLHFAYSYPTTELKRKEKEPVTMR